MPQTSKVVHIRLSVLKEEIDLFFCLFLLVWLFTFIGFQEGIDEFSLRNKNLSLSYDLTEEKSDADKQWVFQDLNFQIESGEFILVAGPSGCGKSSLMNAINGVIPNLKKPCQRIYLYTRQRITDSTVRERTKLVGSVFQNPREQIIFDEVADETFFPWKTLENRLENAGKADCFIKDDRFKSR